MGFELMAYRFVVLFPSAVGEQFVERNYKIVLDFIVYFDRKYITLHHIATSALLSH